MTSFKLSFARIEKLHHNIGEVFVDHGIEVNIEMVEEIHTAFLSIFPSTFSLLINKSNAYSTQLEALERFGKLAAIDKIAVYAPSALARVSADFSAEIPSSATLNIKVFSDRDSALDWLTQYPSES